MINFGEKIGRPKHPDSSAFRRTYSIHYNASFIKEFILVNEDRFRATLALSKMNINKDYKFAEIVYYADTLINYMDRTGLQVES